MGDQDKQECKTRPSGQCPTETRPPTHVDELSRNPRSEIPLRCVMTTLIREQSPRAADTSVLHQSLRSDYGPLGSWAAGRQVVGKRPNRGCAWAGTETSRGSTDIAGYRSGGARLHYRLIGVIWRRLSVQVASPVSGNAVFHPDGESPLN